MDAAEFEAHFERLNAHLAEVRPIFDRFCAQHGFEYVNRKAIGRYPRIRIQRTGLIRVWFDLWMELDSDGNRYETYRPDLPYELSAGADFVEQDGTKHGTRTQLCYACFSGKPFHEVGFVLEVELERNLTLLETWDEQYLREHGERVPLGGKQR